MGRRVWRVLVGNRPRPAESEGSEHRNTETSHRQIETSTLELIRMKLSTNDPQTYRQLDVAVPYPKAPRQKCDWCWTMPTGEKYYIEAKMMRLMGDNGKPARWAWIEYSLSVLLLKILGAEAKPALAMFSVLNGQRLQVSAVKAAARAAIPIDQFEIFATAISAIDSVKKDRDRLAHWIWGTFADQGFVDSGFVLSRTIKSMFDALIIFIRRAQHYLLALTQNSCLELLKSVLLLS